MAELPTSGKIEIQESHGGAAILAPVLYPELQDNQPLTADFLRNLLQVSRITYGMSEDAIVFYVQLITRTNRPVEKAYLAMGTPSFRRGVEKIVPAMELPVAPENILAWRMLYHYYTNISPDIDFPYQTALVHQGQTLATKSTYNDEVPGKSVYGLDIHASRGQMIDYKPGANVAYDEKTRTFTAKTCGYVFFLEQEITVIDALYITEDKMEVRFRNLPRTNPGEYPLDSDLPTWCRLSKIDLNLVTKAPIERTPVFTHPILLHSEYPGVSKDGTVEFKIEMEKQAVVVDDSQHVDFKERNLFRSIAADTLIAVKTLPVIGKNGCDLFQNTVKSRTPQDVVLKSGGGIRLDRTEEQLRFFAQEDGVLDYKNDILTVMASLPITGDVDMSTGHIDSKANIEIRGSVKSGFNVSSDRNILIRGVVEEACNIVAKGNLTILGGVMGEHTNIQCSGDFNVKYIDGCSVTVNGRVTVQSFINRGRIECLDNIVVLGGGIDLNERGAIQNSEIFLRGRLYVPVIGNESGMKTFIHIAFDRAQEAKIKQMEDTCDKITAAIAALKAQFDIDISNPQIYNQLSGYTADRKEEVIKAIQEKNRMEKQLDMMKKIRDKEIEKKKEILSFSRIEVSRRIVPDLVLFANELQRTIDKIDGPSVYYFDQESLFIERQMYSSQSATTPERKA